MGCGVRRGGGRAACVWGAVGLCYTLLFIVRNAVEVFTVGHFLQQRLDVLFAFLDVVGWAADFVIFASKVIYCLYIKFVLD